MNTNDARARKEDGAAHPALCSTADVKKEIERLAYFLYELYKTQQNIKQNARKE